MQTQQDGPFLLSLAQQRQLLIDESASLNGMAPAPTNLVECRRLRGSLDLRAFDHALQCIVDRHLVLRTAVRAASRLAPYRRWRALEKFARTGTLPAHSTNSCRVVRSLRLVAII